MMENRADLMGVWFSVRTRRHGMPHGRWGSAHRVGYVAQDRAFVPWWKKKPMPAHEGPGFERRYLMQWRIFHVHSLRKPMPSAAGPGFEHRYLMHGLIFRVHRLRKPAPPAAGPNLRRLWIMEKRWSHGSGPGEARPPAAGMGSWKPCDACGQVLRVWRRDAHPLEAARQQAERCGGMKTAAAHGSLSWMSTR